MKKSLKCKILIICLVMACLPIISFAGEEIFLPDYTDEFKKWSELPEEEREKYIEPQMYENPYYNKIQMFSDENNELLGAISLPTKFERNDYGEVRNQTTNSCWAQSAATVFENNYFITNSKKLKFSAIFMDYITSYTYNSDGFNRKYNSGGNMTIAAAYATNGIGIALESNMPSKITNSSLKNVAPTAKLSDYDIIYSSEIKQYVYKYGALSIETYVSGRQYFSSSNLYGNTDLAYYCSDETQLADHAVTIVGWDDNYENSAFPEQRGAYLVLNSYGTGFGDNGLYHIFYNDVFVKDNVFLAVTKTDDIDYYKLYQYDEYGTTGITGFEDTTYCANVFTRETNIQEKLKEISIYFPYDGSLTVYINENGDDKNIYNATTTFETEVNKAGYHTIEVPSNVILSSNQFTVIVKYDGYAMVEMQSEKTTSWYYTVTSNSGESFISSNGTKWFDFKDVITTRAINANIKAFTEKFEYVDDLENYMFDYKYYADHNLDIYSAFGYNEVSLRNHWLCSGINEGRKSSPIFDVRYYLENNEDLKAAFGNNYQAAYNHFINVGYSELRPSSVEYNGAYYKNNNGDLANMTAIELIRHYFNYGRYELRQANTGYDIINYMFDANLYAQLNEDVAKVVGYNENNLRNHWYRYGISEGRIASLIFDAKYYLKENEDVAKAYSSQNYLAAYIHFTESGFAEGRQGNSVFGVKYYLEKNGDLKSAFGSNYLIVLNHFIYSGIREARQTSSCFNVLTYECMNPDLYDAFQANYELYYIHYLKYGQNENRVCI